MCDAAGKMDSAVPIQGVLISRIIVVEPTSGRRRRVGPDDLKPDSSGAIDGSNHQERQRILTPKLFLHRV